jgi:acetyl-CoA synthetase
VNIGGFGDACSQAAREHLTWFRLFERVMSGGLERGDVAWFLQGQLNAAYNCVDRHAAARPDDTAILWEGDRPGDVRRISFRQLFEDVCRLANVLRDRCGVRKGDRVGLSTTTTTTTLLPFFFFPALFIGCLLGTN